MKEIQILMSTYNGEKYLKEQLDSIFKQKGVKVHLLVRDDGSKDETLKILKQYDEIEVVTGKNEGPTNSFLDLIELAGDYDYYAFSDQDDVWDDDKLLVAISMLAMHEGPAVYSSDTRIVDEDLQFIKKETKSPVVTLGSAIVKNYITGCTTVFNKELMVMLKKYKPNHAPFHDWWINLVCLSIGGKSIFDNKPHISYRQHGDNVVSGNATFIKKWSSRLKKFIQKPYGRDKMAQEIIEKYADNISGDNYRILNAMMNKKYTKEMRTGNVVDDLLFALCLIFRKV
ncbi:glycosyltransferase [Dubosiella newyorkensis]|uniref:glycosyltransferase n=1 Tax=Dubosiella newyorkensis TaxID=1862672 RepID=UPI0024BB96A0|nr:glycosyltransferase [Dubosiella newyorkensis]